MMEGLGACRVYRKSGCSDLVGFRLLGLTGSSSS